MTRPLSSRSPPRTAASAMTATRLRTLNRVDSRTARAGKRHPPRQSEQLLSVVNRSCNGVGRLASPGYDYLLERRTKYSQPPQVLRVLHKAWHFDSDLSVARSRRVLQ